ncbi:AbrB/MazE/SpoVT family DNA-binding domain-containing protein [Bacillus sonorensis]|uniref:Transcriptional regulator n=2 Tax=Bacillus sonorensis TaxID=119858 RepID=M5P1A2_9BACI|nr:MULTISPECIES: AbrB/MazE/SpoVT family DNA-binding domain-containing protein [Bacillus]TWK79484.1 putative transition state regulator Abh [Bacillus paralicheniformis]ASB87310.1 Transition state regulatory protein AbrB [Bacillus sonorensis]EME73208.1 transcriptional regulator [Bacillus sonorensis L12]MBG9914203.1 AbrB family transcriptional regulator [Bacillus sonorensis]MCF7616553.1 AbrB/MazE/SpoVT family DNA-binding domain-containing protein [Bacillus sonorensis]
MKNTGIVRRIDELGRVVLPVELRRVLNIKEKDPLEIYSDGDNIILAKYAANMACLMTGEITTQNKTYAGGKIILSPRGAEMLLEDLLEALSNRK